LFYPYSEGVLKLTFLSLTRITEDYEVTEEMALRALKDAEKAGADFCPLYRITPEIDKKLRKAKESSIEEKLNSQNSPQNLTEPPLLEIKTKKTGISIAGKELISIDGLCDVTPIARDAEFRKILLKQPYCVRKGRGIRIQGWAARELLELYMTFYNAKPEIDVNAKTPMHDVTGKLKDRKPINLLRRRDLIVNNNGQWLVEDENMEEFLEYLREYELKGKNEENPIKRDSKEETSEYPGRIIIDDSICGLEDDCFYDITSMLEKCPGLRERLLSKDYVSEKERKLLVEAFAVAELKQVYWDHKMHPKPEQGYMPVEHPTLDEQETENDSEISEARSPAIKKQADLEEEEEGLEFYFEGSIDEMLAQQKERKLSSDIARFARL